MISRISGCNRSYVARTLGLNSGTGRPMYGDSESRSTSDMIRSPNDSARAGLSHEMYLMILLKIVQRSPRPIYAESPVATCFFTSS